jgi:transcriptional regulator with XRE-family HTH domain
VDFQSTFAVKLKLINIREVKTMKPQKDMKQLGELVKCNREQAGLSARGLEELSGLDHSFISKLEKAKYGSVSTETLTTLASALKIPASDLFALAGYQIPGALPSFGPYLRAKYGDELPEGARAALNELFETLSRNFGGSELVDDENEDELAAPPGRRE